MSWLYGDDLVGVKLRLHIALAYPAYNDSNRGFLDTLLVVLDSFLSMHQSYRYSSDEKIAPDNTIIKSCHPNGPLLVL